MADEKKKPDRGIFVMKDGKQTDLGLHDLNDDKEFIRKINDKYRTVKETK